MLNCNVTCDECGKESGWYSPVKIDKTHRQSMYEAGFVEDAKTLHALCFDCAKLNKQPGESA